MSQQQVVDEAKKANPFHYLEEPEEIGEEAHVIQMPLVGEVPIFKGDWEYLPLKVRQFVEHWVAKMTPRAVHVCDGSHAEAQEIIEKITERGVLQKLTKYENCYICRTDPADVARVESKTWMCTKDKYQAVPHVREGAQGILGQWKSEDDAKEHIKEFDGCMKGRTMYVIPFSMGPIGSPLSKIGIELTDSNYVVLCMHIMTRVSHKVLEVLGDGEFVRCVHSMGAPRPTQRKVVNHWPCNPEKIFIGHFADRRQITSFGSGYGGNSLLGKKCFALRIAMNIARDEGWLAEHMLIMGITIEKTGKTYYISAAFPSACGKTNMAMLTPGLPGYKVTCVGDDIAWMRFDEKGQLHGINPESGFFGVCPGTNMKTNPNAMLACGKNTIFTNVASTSDGGFFWEGLEKEVDISKLRVTDWLGNPWKPGSATKAAHPNSRFTALAGQCPIIDPKWEDPRGVPICAFIFGGRRPYGIPLVYEAFSWEHGVMVAACVKSEATAAAEHAGKKIMHDPMAMRPFMGYNFGKYLDHWLSLNRPPLKVPKIFHCNWFRVNEKGEFLWPGFGENIRVVDWILRRVEGDESIAVKTPIGYLPKKGSLNLDGLDEKYKKNWDELFKLSKDYLSEDCAENIAFFKEQVGEDLPKRIQSELEELKNRIEAMDK